MAFESTSASASCLKLATYVSSGLLVFPENKGQTRVLFRKNRENGAKSAIFTLIFLDVFAIIVRIRSPGVSVIPRTQGEKPTGSYGSYQAEARGPLLGGA